MAFAVRVLADSISPTGDRLTTILGTYPRKIHSEIMTHRILSKCSASSRAIPVEKMLANIENDPVVPIWWGKNEPGMQAWAEVEDKASAEAWWREGLSMMVAHARRGHALGLHKQIVNRVVEPGMWITVVMSGTTWTNFEGLRCHKDAEPHFQRFAGMTMEAIAKSVPEKIPEGAWHLPFIQPEDVFIACSFIERLYEEARRDKDEAQFKKDVDEVLRRVSVGRCARVSYLTHDGKRDLAEDIRLHDRLIVQVPLHATPAEHVAMALDWPAWFKIQFENLARHSSKTLNVQRMDVRKRLETSFGMSLDELAVEAALAQIQSGNFRGFRQYRKMKMNEHIGEPMP
jgi:hypothetical protein